MHQPFYKDTETNRYFLPWVRLHAVKDYLHIAEVIGDFPSVRQTINLVPSLLVQLEDYAKGNATDPCLDVSRRQTLSANDKAFILDNFFSINWDRFVWPVPRYSQLARLREAAQGEVDLLGYRFWLDLIVWFNLAWIDPSTRQREPRLRAIVARGKDFDRADVAVVLEYHRAACARVIPAYRELAERGQIELSTTPFYHPIVPLLIDTSSARGARPDVPLPDGRFSHPEDARDHLDQAVRFHEHVFGRPPRGVWPAEGAISQATIELASAFPTISWIASDEHLLERALGTRFARDGYGHLQSPAALCQPYRVDGLPVAVYFRDQTLSDRIGFVYQQMDSERAADDFVDRLLNVWQKVASDTRPRVISIILDGENCWESYPNNGDDFLRALFDRLSREPRLQTITPSEFLDRFGATAVLPRLPTGSWIGANLDTWIGEPDQNRAWDLLGLARAQLARWERENGSVDAPPSKTQEVSDRLKRARHALMVAEGSDWFWWYYSHNRFGNERVFDAAFRRHLANVYRAIGAPVPAWLDHPIFGTTPRRRREFSGWLTVSQLSDAPIASDEWAGAGFVEPETSTGTMQAGETNFRRLYFGCDRDKLYVRVETNGRIGEHEVALYVGTNQASRGIAAPTGQRRGDGPAAGDRFQWRVTLSAGIPPSVRLFQAGQDDTWEQTTDTIAAVFGESTTEIQLERSLIGAGPNDSLRLMAVVTDEGGALEVLPASGPASIRLSVPGGNSASAGDEGLSRVTIEGERGD